MDRTRLQKIYTLAYDFLQEHKPPSLSTEDLNAYFHTLNREECDGDLNFIVKRLFYSMQGYQRMPNVIGFDIREEQLSEILCEFNPKDILKKHTVDSLYETFYDAFQFKNKESKRNLWLKWTKAIMSGSDFMSHFSDTSEFHEFCMHFSYNKFTKASLPMLLAKEIYGIGFTLACDFLKEIGYGNYPKPDVHIIDIFYQTKISKTKAPYDVFKAVIEMAESVNETPYKVDKIFWLISSGSYYLHKVRIKRYKAELIQKVNSM